MTSSRTILRRSTRQICAGIILALVFLTGTHAVNAQSPSMIIGDPPNTDKMPVRFGFLNLDNLNLHLEIPLASYPARGHDPITITAIYDSTMWVTGSNTYLSAYPAVGPATGGMRFVVQSGPAAQYPFNSGATYMNSCASNNNGYTNGSYAVYPGSDWTITDPDGTSHSYLMPNLTDQSFCYNSSFQHEPASDSPPTTATGFVFDGEGSSLVLNLPNPYGNFQVWAANGDTYGECLNGSGCTTPVGPETPNGNYGGDTLGGAVSQGCLQSGSALANNGTPYAAGTTQLCTISIPSGGSFTVTYTASPVSTNFFPGQAPYEDDYSGNIWLPTSVSLPDGSSYTFGYDTGTAPGSYGELTSIQLPTGGSVQYGWNFQSPLADDGFALNQIVDNGNTTQITSTTTNSSPNDANTTVFAPSRAAYGGQAVSDKTVYAFPNNNSGLFQVQKYAGSSTLLETIQYTRPDSGGPNNVTSIVDTLAATGLAHETDYQYVGATNLISQKQEKYNGTLYRTVNLTYQGDTATIKYNSTYNMLSYPASVTVTDNLNGNVKVAGLSYTYDEYTASYCKNSVPMLQLISGATGHDDARGTSYLARGNPTTITSWISSSKNQSVHNCYDTLGNLTQTVDGNGNPTTYSYVDNYSDNTCIPSSSATYAFPTVVTDALSHQTKTSYYSCYRLPHDVQDPNDLAAGRTAGTTYTYDNWSRPISVSYPDNGSMSVTYTPTSTTTTRQTASGSQPLSSETVLDSMGRVSEQINNGGGSTNAEVDSTYDYADRLSTKSNPHQQTAFMTDGISTFYYDALGNLITTLNQDGQTTQTAVYTGTCVLKTDEAGHQREACSDGLGRMICVGEPNPTTGFLPKSCNGATPAPSYGTSLAYLTTYKYDALNNLISAYLPGDTTTHAAETRTFTYDGLSRPVTSQTPEAGSACFGTVSGISCTSGYDGVGTLLSYTDARGAVTKITSIDSLNRPLTRSYTLPSPNTGPAAVLTTSSVTYGYDGNKAGGGSLGYGITYNEVGQLSQIMRGATSTTYAYDPMGRMTDQWNILPSSTTAQWHTNIQYDLAGEAKQITYPDSRVVTQAWTSAGWLSTVTLASFNGTAVNKAYVASNGNYPTGASYFMTLGDSVNNNTVEAWKYDSRLRLCEIATSIGNPVNAAPGSPGAFGSCGTPIATPMGEQTVVDKLYSYTANSNIQTVTDHLNGNWSESASYDYRDTLHAWSNSSGASETYAVDPWGCLAESGTHTFTPNCTSNIKNQLPSASSYIYDLAGNMIQDGSVSMTGHLYNYYADGQLGTIEVAANTPTATYTYDGDGGRVRKDYNGTFTEYLFVGGSLLAQHNSDGTWSDNIYAQGKKIARSDSYDRRIDAHGTYAQTGVEAATNFSQLNGYTIQSGDHLYWRQYNSGANGGLNLIAGGFQTAGIVKDTNGVYINDQTTQGSWVEREVDLTSYAGVTLTNAQFVTDTSTSPGTWDIYFGDVALVHPDGTVIAIYNRGTSFATGGYVTPSGVTNQATTVKTASTTLDGANPTETTTYYISDQIGSSRMDIAYGSWPTWWGAFDPYGAEIDTNVTTNNYKFSGVERDAQTGESGLDNFGARSYSSNLVGKFMQPDPAGLASVNLWNPMSFYMYGYVLNNPLNATDPTGMTTCFTSDGSETGHTDAGGVGATDDACTPPIDPDPDPQRGDGKAGVMTPAGPVFPPTGKGDKPSPGDGKTDDGGAADNPGPVAPDPFILPYMGNYLVRHKASWIAPNKPQPPQAPKKPCPPATRIAGTLKALNAVGDGGAFFTLAGIHFAAAGFLVGATCLTPEPGEPVACAAGVFGGSSLVAGGTVLAKVGYNHTVSEVSEGIKQATCSEVQ